MPVLLTDAVVELCKATWTLNGGSAVNLGLTQEGSKVAIKRDGVIINANELGSTAIDFKGNGWDIDIELMLMATTIDNLAIALGSTKTTVASNSSVDLDLRVGNSLPYGELVLHPAQLGAGVLTRDWKFFRAQIPTDGFLAEYVAGKALTWPLKFKGTPVQDLTTGKVKIACFGNPATAVDYDVAL